MKAGAGFMTAGVLALAVVFAPVAQSKPKARQASAAQVRELLKLNGYAARMQVLLKAMVSVYIDEAPCVPASYWKGLSSPAALRENLDAVVPVFQRRFTHGDLDGLLKFYRSPLGRKMVREMPATLIDAMHATHRANHRRMEALTETLIRKGTLVRDGIKDSPGKCPGIRSRPGPPPPPPASGNGLH